MSSGTAVLDKQPLNLSAAQWQAIVQHLRRELPNEACGLLGGIRGVVQKVYLIENELHSPSAYQMKPQAQVRAMLEMENNGWELCGIFHSHPHGLPVPSASDVAQAYYPEAVYLICAPGEQGEWRRRGFKIEAGQVTEVEIKLEG